MTAQEAIQESISTDSIILIDDATQDDMDTLYSECDDNTDANDGWFEFWKNDEQDESYMLWRVHARMSKDRPSDRD